MIVFFFLVVTTMGQKIYYISSSTGNNSYDGLAELYDGKSGPWQTLAKVASHRFNIGDKILLKRGDSWAETLEISSNGIIIGAYGSGNEPVINGANTVTGWTLHNAEKNIWRASVNTTNPVTQVFVNGERQTIARWPNNGWHSISTTSSNNTILRSNYLTQPLNYWQGSRIIYRYNWAFAEANIIASSNGTITMTGAPDNYNPSKDWGFYIEGKFEELDNPGEYYWDNTNKSLYLVVNNGENPNNKVIEASVRSFGINSNIKSNISISDITVRNAALSGIRVLNCSDIQVFNCTIENCKQFGVLILRTSGISTRLTVENCTISHVDGGGGGRFAAGISVEGNISNLNILKNNISDISSDTASPRWGTGIYIGYGVSNSNVEGNSITRTSNNGIHLARHSSRTRVAHNIIHNCITLLDDAGGIYLNGDQTGTIVEYNRISDCVGSREGAPMNYVPLTMGLYSDAYDNFGTIYRGNIVSGCTYGALIHMSKNTTLYNNTFYNNGHGIYLSEKGANEMSGNLIKNNICVASKTSQFPITIIRHARSNAPIGTFDHNLYHNKTNNIAVRYGISSTNASNLTLIQWKNKTGLDSGNDVNSINSDPKFANVQSDDFQLSENSPCIDAGTNVGLLKDFNGTSIPKGDSPDIGAFEYFFFNNGVPVANAGNDQTVNEGETVILDGSASFDPDDDELTYIWTAPIGVILSSDSTNMPTFIAPEVVVTTQYKFFLVVNDGYNDSQPSEVIITVENVNKPPVANAGIEQTVNEGEIVYLDGSASFDPDSYSISFIWTAPEGIVLSSTNLPETSFIAPEVTADTQYSFILTVNDGYSDSQPSEVIITVLNVNKPPLANAGQNQTVYEGEMVNLDGSDSFDPDGDDISYQWNAPEEVVLSSPVSARPSFLAPEVMEDTQFVFSLIVNDGYSDSELSEVTITVVNVNKPPVSKAGINQTVNEGTLVTLDGTGSSDPDGDQLTYKWTAPPEITLSSTTVSKPTFVAPEVTQDQQYTITLVVNDGTVDSPLSKVIITVKNVNKVPIANAGINQTVNEGSLVTLDGSGSYDPDGDQLTFRWTAPDGILLTSHDLVNPSFLAPEVTIDTQFTFSLKVSDGLSESLPSEVKITVVNVNKPPVADAGNDQIVKEGEIVYLDGSASFDPDGNELSYHWITPDGIVLNSPDSVKPSFLAPEVINDTQFSFSLIVNDGFSESQSSEVFVTVLNVNKPPIADAGTNQSVYEGDIVEMDGSASFDPDNDLITFRWFAPEGIQLSSDTSANPVFIAPEVTSDTFYTFSLIVNDGQLESIPSVVVISVIHLNSTPVADAGTNQTVIEGELVYLNGSDSFDPDNDEITFRWIAPEDIQLSSETSANPVFIAPEVTTDTQYAIILVVNDGKTDSEPSMVVVTVFNLNKPPVAKAGKFLTVFEGEIVTLDGTSSYDPDNDEISYQWIPPEGFQFSSVTSATPSFIVPTVKSDTIVHVLLIVSDGNTYSMPDTLKITIRKIFKKGESFDSSSAFAFMYPNPANSYLNIILSEDFCANTTTITIVDVLGNVCFKSNYKVVEKITIDTNAFLPGFYTLIIKCDSVLQIEKLIIQSNH